MAGGKIELDPEKLAEHCELFMKGTKRLYNGERIKSCKGDMWFFELYHHLTDCANALRRTAVEPQPAKLTPQSEPGEVIR